MNVYIEVCKERLNAIIRGDMGLNEHLCCLRKDINLKLTGFDTVIVCGLPPLARRFMEWMKKTYPEKKLLVFDLRALKDGRNLTADDIKKVGHKALYVITSREEAYTYRELAGNKTILSYNEILLAVPQISDEQSLFHNENYVTSRIAHIFQHAQSYLEIMEERLSDIYSQELLAKMVLYRLYLDLNLFDHVKSCYEHYFDEDIVQLGEQECFADVGGFDGDTLDAFLKAAEGRYKTYYFFEPDKQLMDKAKKNHGKEERIVWMNIGLWDENKEMFFNGDGSGSQGRVGEGGISISCKRLDDLNIGPITFLKMDIEGSEIKALQGARETIVRDKPKLAVCIYHRAEDITDIITFIHGLGYEKFYIRCGERTLDYECIVYAVL